MESYDRYAQFRTGDGFEIVPFGEVPRKGTDRYEIYKKGQTDWTNYHISIIIVRIMLGL